MTARAQASRTSRTSRSPFATQPCRDCGEPIRLVRLLVDNPVKGEATWVPLVPRYPTYHGDVPASHALSAGRTTARPLRRGERPDPTEHLALIHQAVCKARVKPAVPDWHDDLDADADA